MLEQTREGKLIHLSGQDTLFQYYVKYIQSSHRHPPSIRIARSAYVSSFPSLAMHQSRPACIQLSKANPPAASFDRRPGVRSGIPGRHLGVAQSARSVCISREGLRSRDVSSVQNHVINWVLETAPGLRRPCHGLAYSITDSPVEACGARTGGELPAV